MQYGADSCCLPHTIHKQRNIFNEQTICFQSILSNWPLYAETAGQFWTEAAEVAAVFSHTHLFQVGTQGSLPAYQSFPLATDCMVSYKNRWV